MASYRQAGVDIDAGLRAVDLIREQVRSTYRPEVLAGVGPFGSMFALGEYRQPVLVSSTDSVGTKLKVAFALDRHDTIGIDLVNHCVNDILTTGAEPLFFLDYFATSKLMPEQVAGVVKGLAQACREAGCALIGGETAELPGFYHQGEYDVAGFIVGVVERDAIIDGSRIQPGDVLLGLSSSGLHTNGFSLARRVFGLDVESLDEVRKRLGQSFAELGRTLGEELLEPHRCYLNQLRPFLPQIKGLAHITGGGVVDNVPRMLPQGTAAVIRRGSWSVPPIFQLIERLGGVDHEEMYRVFNMGIGMVVALAPADAERLIATTPDVLRIGQVVSSPERRIAYD